MNEVQEKQVFLSREDGIFLALIYQFMGSGRSRISIDRAEAFIQAINERLQNFEDFNEEIEEKEKEVSLAMPTYLIDMEKKEYILYNSINKDKWYEALPNALLWVSLQEDILAIIGLTPDYFYYYDKYEIVKGYLEMYSIGIEEAKEFAVQTLEKMKFLNVEIKDAYMLPKGYRKFRVHYRGMKLLTLADMGRRK